jgi:hypothetical protein
MWHMGAGLHNTAFYIYDKKGGGMTEMTDKQKLNLLVDLAKAGKEMLEGLADENDKLGTPVNRGSAIGIRSAVKAFDNAFALVGEPL